MVLRELEQKKRNETKSKKRTKDSFWCHPPLNGRDENISRAIEDVCQKVVAGTSAFELEIHGTRTRVRYVVAWWWLDEIQCVAHTSIPLGSNLAELTGVTAFLL